MEIANVVLAVSAAWPVQVERSVTVDAWYARERQNASFFSTGSQLRSQGSPSFPAIEHSIDMTKTLDGSGSGGRANVTSAETIKR